MNPYVIGLALLVFLAPASRSDTLVTSAITASTLSLTEVIRLALANDPWATGSSLREQALIETSEASAQLPDPRIKLMVGNLPVDSWSLAQEPMTQLSVGIQQVIPRGDSLSLARTRGYHRVTEERELREERVGQVRLRVTKLWLDVVQHALERERLIASQPMFDDLEALIQARYRSGMAQISQSDMVRATMEITQLEERITHVNQKLALSQQKLIEWIGERAYHAPAQLPALSEVRADLIELLAQSPEASDAQLFGWVEQHPRLKALAARVEAANTDISLAETSIKPAWAVEASYGYRADDALGRSRADLFSVGISFDMPLFTRERQDRTIRASKASAASLETDRQLLTRELLRSLRSALVNFQHAQDRYKTYAESLLPQLELHVETALAAYNNDQAELSEAIIAHITALNTEIRFIHVDVERYRALADLAYLTGLSGLPASHEQPEGDQS